MKRYEICTQQKLLRRTPVIIRVDGKAFHSFTRKFPDRTPFSEIMHARMSAVTVALVMQVQTAVLAYTQSDEVSVLLKDWSTHETQQWFDGSVQKLASVASSIATAAFNYSMMQAPFFQITQPTWPTCVQDFALFDARAFNVPMEEVTNYFIWRQQDATRNSIQMLGRHYFSQKQMHGLNGEQIQEKIWQEHDVNWNDLSTWMKRGSCVKALPSVSSAVPYVDDDIPIFTADRNYIEDLLKNEEA